MESLLASYPPLIQEAWISMRGWYKDVSDCPLPLSRMYIATMMAEQVDLYRQVPPLVQLIPVGVELFPVYDSIPEDKEIA